MTADKTPRHNQGILCLRGLSHVWLVETPDGDQAAFPTWDEACESVSLLSIRLPVWPDQERACD